MASVKLRNPAAPFSEPLYYYEEDIAQRTGQPVEFPDDEHIAPATLNLVSAYSMMS